MPEPSLKLPKDVDPELKPRFTRWWAHPEGDPRAATEMLSTSKNIDLNQKGREAKMLLYARMYGGLSYMKGMKFSGALSIGAAGSLSVAQSPRYNLGWSLVDTSKALICKEDTRVTFLTDDGSMELQNKAKSLDEYCQGIFYQTNIYDVGEEVFGDAGIFGLGHMRIWHRFDNIDVRRVFPNCLKVDIWDGADRRPRCFYETSTEDRDVLAEMYKDDDEKVKAIWAAPSVTSIGEASLAVGSNKVELTDAWHLRSGPNADDGRHILVLTASGKALEDEPYEEDDAPYVTIRWNKALVGWYGQGLCELLIGHQRELNRTLQVEATSHHIMSIPRVAAEINSKVNKNHITSNRMGPIWWYQGTPPQALNWPAVSGDFVQWKDWIIASAHDFTGISENAAQATKPAGLDSAVAQREFKDTQSDRLAMKQKMHDYMYLMAADRIVSVARHLYKNGKSLSARVIGRDFVKTVKFDDGDLKRDEFQLKLYPTSMLPKSPAGRLQATQELLQAGFIDKDTAVRLLNFPDLDDVTSLLTAKQDNIKTILDGIIYQGKEPPPADPIQDLNYGLQYGQMLYLKSWDKGVPKERRDRVVSWMAQARDQIKNATTPPSPPPGVGPAPQAVPQAPPVSQLLPNAPPHP